MANTHINHEVAVLHSWVEKRFDGTPIPGEAFGIGASLRTFHEPPSLKAKDYNFCIQCEQGVLTLQVDTYTAIYGLNPIRGFDDEAFFDGFLELQKDACRQGYRALHQAARILLKGRDVHLPNGEIIKGVVKC